jgi:hypothetical protein
VPIAALGELFKFDERVSRTVNAQRLSLATIAMMDWWDMSPKVSCRSCGCKPSSVTLAVLVGLVCFAIASSSLRAQNAPASPIKAGAGTVGERVQSATDALVRAFSFGADLSPQTLIKILPGDWTVLSSEAFAGDIPADKLKQWCSFNRVSIKQTDPACPIFEGRIGREGSRRFELRLSVGAAFYWIANVQDEMRALGLDNSPDADLAKLQRGLVMQRSVQQGVAFPLNDDVIGFQNTAVPSSASFWVRCPGEPEDGARSARNIQIVNTIVKTMAQQAGFLSYGSDGSVPFVSKIQGSWTLVDELAKSKVRDKTVAELCQIRRVDMQANHQPLPILTAHVIDTTSDYDRPVPASQDEFESRLAGDGELMRVALHDPMVEVKEHPERLRIPPAAERDAVAKRLQQTAIGWYRQTALSAALPLTLVPIDDDTLVESPKNTWGEPPSYDSGPSAFKRYWLRCPQS